MELRTILVAVDFAPASMRAIETACALARSFDAEVVLFHCCDVHGYAYSTELLLLDVIAGMRTDASRRLDAMASRLRDAGLRVRTIVAEGVAYNEALEAARREHADLVIAGTHGYRGLARAVLGSVAERIVRLSEVPVLTTHELYFETRQQAGELLAREIDAASQRFDSVVASSLVATSLVAIVASKIAARADALIVEPLTAGTEDTMFGVVSECGAMVDVPRAIELGVPSPEHAGARAVHRARDTGDALRARARLDVSGRAALLVFDRIDRAEVALFGARTLQTLGAARVAIGVPIGCRPAIEALQREGLRVFCPLMTELDVPRAPYREERPPDAESPSVVLTHLAGAAPCD